MKVRNVKPWYRSKTIIFNILAAALIAAEQSGQYLQPILGDRTYPVVMFAVVMVNVFLRCITDQVVTAK